MNNECVIGIDIGGTKTTSAVFNDQGEPITEFKVKKSRHLHLDFFICII